MSFSKTTPNLKLPVYESADKPTYLGDWNQAMESIDTGYGGVKNIETEVDGLTKSVSTLNAQMNTTQSSPLNTKIDGIKNSNIFQNYSGFEMVCFGDSYVNPDTATSNFGQVPNTIAKTFNMTLHNFAKGGSRFIGTTTTNQITQANTSMTADQKAKTKLVLIYEGDSDVKAGSSAADIASAIVNIVKLCNQMFPNAKILLVPFEWGFGNLADSQETVILDTIELTVQKTAQYPVQILKNARWYVFGVAEYFTSGGVHCTELGYSVISSYLVNALLGASDDVIKERHWSNFIGKEAKMTCTFNNGMVNLTGYVKVDKEIAAGSSYVIDKVPAPWIHKYPDYYVPAVINRSPVSVQLHVGATNIEFIAGQTVPVNSIVWFSCSFKSNGQETM